MKNEIKLAANSSQGSYFNPFLGERLRIAREYLGYSSQESAKHIGVDHSLVLDIESGISEVSNEILKKFSDLYLRSVGWLTSDPKPAESSAPLPKGLEAKDWQELRTFKNLLESYSRSFRKSYDIERLSTFMGAGKCLERLHQELNTYQSSVDNGYVDIFDAISRLEITLILRPINSLGSVFRVGQRSGLILSVNRPVIDLRLASASALVLLMGIFRQSQTKTDKFWYSLMPEDELNKFERENLKASLDILLPTYLIANLQTKNKWTNTDLTNPVNMYQASLRLEMSYQATVRAYLRSQCISVTEAKKLLQENLTDIKRTILERYIPDNLENINVWLLSQNEEGTVIRSNPNDIFVVKVKENGAAGYRWNFSELQELGFVILKDYNTVKNPKQIGARSLRTLFTTPGKAKDGMYEIEESRPWQRNTTKINSLSIPYKRLSPVKTGLYSSETANNERMVA